MSELKQIEPVKQSDITGLSGCDLYDTWIDLWGSGKSPDIVSHYL